MASPARQPKRDEARESPQVAFARRHGHLGPRGYLWATLVLLAGSMLGHWTFGWLAYVEDAREHGQAPELATYSVLMARDTLENWQSEFLQLIWQVAGLAVLLYVGSPQSKEGQERVEAKLDFLLSQTAKGEAKRKELDREFLRKS
jgi:hypothetical protein